MKYQLNISLLKLFLCLPIWGNYGLSLLYLLFFLFLNSFFNLQFLVSAAIIRCQNNLSSTTRQKSTLAKGPTSKKQSFSICSIFSPSWPVHLIPLLRFLPAIPAAQILSLSLSLSLSHTHTKLLHGAHALFSAVLSYLSVITVHHPLCQTQHSFLTVEFEGVCWITSFCKAEVYVKGNSQVYTDSNSNIEVRCNKDLDNWIKSFLCCIIVYVKLWYLILYLIL
jgi:hypothetical protein